MTRIGIMAAHAFRLGRGTRQQNAGRVGVFDATARGLWGARDGALFATTPSIGE